MAVQRAISAVLLLGKACALPSYLGTSPVQVTTYTSPSLSWYDCTIEALEGVQCANLSVPLDWSNPETSERINLLMTKLPASGTADEKIGSLIYNPGGPGGVATLGVASYARNRSYLATELRRKFDLIGPDPRGIGYSSPLQCDGPTWNPRVSRRPQTEEEFDTLVNHNRAVGESCRNVSGRLVDFMDTTSVARDFEAIRVALGNEPLNYLGFSYGTQIGMAYAELFPRNIRSMVIDGVLDHYQPETYMYVSESQAYERELGRFFDWCNTTTSCAWNGRDAPRLFDELVQKATESPIPAPGCDKDCRQDVTADELLYAVDGTILRKDPIPGRSVGWAYLSQNLDRALSGNATAFSEPLWYEGISQIEANSLWGQFGVVCQDWFHNSRSVAETKNKNQLAVAVAPHTRGVSQSYNLQVQCLGWPTALTNPPHFANIHGTPNPILLVNSYYDPSTSYVWAVAGQMQIENGVLLTRDGDGHTSYGLGGETSRYIDDYLVNLKLPGPNTVLST